jgi:hypothetical protein
MKKYFFIPLFLLILSSCKNQTGNNVFLFNNASFQLLQNEASAKITEVEKDHFFSYFDQQAVNIPMYKHIKSHTHTIYIALPYNTSIQELSDTKLISCDIDSLAQKKDPSYFYNRYECSGEFISEYATSLDGNIVYLLAASSSKEVADSLFSLEAIKSRVVLK